MLPASCWLAVIGAVILGAAILMQRRVGRRRLGPAPTRTAPDACTTRGGEAVRADGLWPEREQLPTPTVLAGLPEQRRAAGASDRVGRRVQPVPRASPAGRRPDSPAAARD
ncbi:hypothetical protein [Brachybacterium sp. JB7]|uniref:hypothetical protein n=1 Tax=Brachybacterium sp. JB7 TaxID=2024478 RepID=UPI001F541669|nr:hypothetical protein [Brachybacterium sp. JB7]